MNKKTTFFGVLCFGISLWGLAQQQADSTKVQQLDAVVITDSKFNLKRENSGKVITKITQADLQHQQGRSIAEIINSTVGIEINGAKSYAGQNLNYYIRGGRNRQVLVLIDGVPLSDASQISNDYDLRLLNANQVESIEILKGASSTLYGSGAATAVINITLKKASKKPIAANFRTALGTNQTQHDNAYYVQDFKNSVSVNGTLNKFSYLAGFGNQFIDGMSSLSSIETDKDPYNAINGNLKLGYQFSKKINTTVYVSFDNFKANFDDVYSGPEVQDVSKTDQHRFGMSSEFKYKKGSIILNSAYNNIKRDISSSYPAIYKAESFVSDVFNRYNFDDTFYTVLGVNGQQSDMESFAIPYGGSGFEQKISPSDAKFTIIDPYANVVYISNFGLNLNVGVRLNNHSEYGSHWVYSLNPSFKKDVGFGYVKGLASYSTAYITPSLYQLFEPTYGNINLKPEDNATAELGAEVHVKNKATISLVYFNRKETNFIDFVDLGNYAYQYQNIDQSFNASGIEFTADFNVFKQFKVKGNATYTKVADKLNLRIPKVKVNASLLYDISESTFLSMSYQYNDDRADSVYNPLTYQNDAVNLKSYNLFDFYISHKLIKNKVLLFASVTNILNETYQELYGYSTKGRNVNLGLNISL